jgi:hypothetical protein
MARFESEILGRQLIELQVLVMQAMLGFDRDHSRNILSTGARYKALGNSFSIYTIAFHYSVLKPLYPRGIKVLSLFSGIGGAEVALHKIGIKLLVVVSVEIEEGARRCIEAWCLGPELPQCERSWMGAANRACE